VDDALLVRGREPFGDLGRGLDRPSRRETAARELAAEGLALQQLLDDIRSAVVLPDVIDGRDVGMVQDAGGFRLLLEAAEPVRVLRKRRRQHLDRDLSSEPWILRPVDLTHPSGADLAEDLVRTEPLAGRERHSDGPSEAADFSFAIQTSPSLTSRTMQSQRLSGERARLLRLRVEMRDVLAKFATGLDLRLRRS